MAALFSIQKASLVSKTDVFKVMNYFLPERKSADKEK